MISEKLRTALFKSKDYHQFLKMVLTEFDEQRGYRTRLAAEAGCQPAYFSQVMAGKVELTPEQAEKLCVFWELSELESDFFFNLVLHGRAGTQSLRRRQEKKLAEIRDQWKNENANYGQPTMNEPSRAALYYSHWLHSAIHLLLTIQSLQTVGGLAKHLQKPEAEILEVLLDLEKAGLAEKSAHEKWTTTQSQIHAPEKDFFAEVHHKNWRTQGLELRKTTLESAVRYTSIHSLSKEDFVKIKELIEEMIKKSRQIIAPSTEEAAACLIVDYFKV